MAKLTVEYRCGHEIPEVRFGGKYREQLEYAKEHLDCPDCYKARKMTERDTHNAALRQELADLPLADLQGSDKQVKWANDLRAQVLTEVRAMLNTVKPERREKVAKVIDLLVKKTESKWWIDHREQSPLKLAADVAKAEGLI